MSKCWTIEDGVAVPYIALRRDGLIQVGEGCDEMLMQPGSSAVIVDNKLQAVASSAPVIVLIKCHSGFHGFWELAEFAERRCAHDGELPGTKTGDICLDCGEAVRSCFIEQPSHRAISGHDLRPEALGHVIARGLCVQGGSGCMDGGAEYLIALKPDVRFSIWRAGRLYGRPAVINVKVEGDELIAFDAWGDVLNAP